MDCKREKLQSFPQTHGPIHVTPGGRVAVLLRIPDMPPEVSAEPKYPDTNRWQWSYPHPGQRYEDPRWCGWYGGFIIDRFDVKAIHRSQAHAMNDWRKVAEYIDSLPNGSVQTAEELPETYKVELRGQDFPAIQYA